MSKEGCIGSTPEWVPLQELMAEGSIGQKFINKLPDLKGRLRPVTVVGWELRRIWWPNLVGSIPGNPAPKTVVDLEKHGLHTVGDVLKLSEDDFEALRSPSIIGRKLRNFLRSLSLTPHAQLFNEYFFHLRLKQYPIPSTNESELISAVNELLIDPLDPKVRAYQSYLWGLNDGIRRLPLEAANDLGIDVVSLTKEEYRRFNPRKLMNWGQLSENDQKLTEYATLPQSSYPRRRYGIVFERDLPENLKRDYLPEWAQEFKRIYFELEEATSKGHEAVRELNKEFFSEVVNIFLDLLKKETDNLPEYVSLTSTSSNAGIIWDRYFIPASRQVYSLVGVVTRVGEIVGGNFNPRSTDFIGIDGVRQARPLPSGVSLESLEDRFSRYIKSNDAMSLSDGIEEIASIVDKELLNKLKEERTRKRVDLQLKINQELVKPGKECQSLISALLQEIPVQYRKKLGDLIELDVRTKRTNDRIERLARVLHPIGGEGIYFLPHSGRLISATLVESTDGNSRLIPNLSNPREVRELEWFYQARGIALKLLNVLPKKIGDKILSAGWFTLWKSDV